MIHRLYCPTIVPAYEGIRLFESEYCTKSRQEIEQRSWYERLFTLPWRPWVTTKIVVYNDPDPNLYQIAPLSFVGHPATIAQVKAAIDNGNTSTTNAPAI